MKKIKARQMKKIEAVFCDLDGTLLNKEHQLPEKNRQMIHKLKERNIPFHIATGRSAESAQTIKNLNPQDLIIASNGAIIKNMDNNEIIYSNMIPEKAMNYMIEKIKHYDLTAIWYKGLDVYSNKDNDITEAYKRVASVHMEQADLAYDKEKPIFKLLLRDLHEDHLEALRMEMEEKRHLNIWGTYSLANTLEVLNRDANKGQAAKYIASLRGYNLENCVAFGDNHNDLQMLKAVGHGVAMQGGRESVISQFEKQAKPSSEAGFALYMEELLESL